MLSCYAPTRAASRAEKDKFFDDLQQALSSIPSNQPYVILGDFNARVGSRQTDDDPWFNVRGPHGYGESNDAGRELLAFLETNVALVCNTWFEKRDINKQTWQHPRSKQWHYIDFAIMRQRDRRRCLDATVVRGAECNTDHQLLCVRVKVLRQSYQRKPVVRRKRFDVSKLTKDSADVVAFQEEIVNRTQTKWPQCGSAEEKWIVMKSALTEAAEAVLGTESRRQPDWFDESRTLQPALQHRNQLYKRWLATQSTADLQRFRKARIETRQAIRAAKNAWFQAKAEEVQRGRFGGKVGWKGSVAVY